MFRERNSLFALRIEAKTSLYAAGCCRWYLFQIRLHSALIYKISVKSDLGYDVYASFCFDLGLEIRIHLQIYNFVSSDTTFEDVFPAQATSVEEYLQQVHKMAMIPAVQEAQKDDLRNFSDYMMTVLEVTNKKNNGCGSNESLAMIPVFFTYILYAKTACLHLQTRCFVQVLVFWLEFLVATSTTLYSLRTYLRAFVFQDFRQFASKINSAAFDNELQSCDDFRSELPTNGLTCFGYDELSSKPLYWLDFQVVGILDRFLLHSTSTVAGDLFSFCCIGFRKS
ncbi:hypothetical protein SSX86_010775 [Deinandra increscens subsp. villosa]|uniref:Uncharacterized protein n=1 Tax=Deinandra increscens subsp. villosa TaxID=3103831 RepID=A0AAP0DFX6_9ASTR